MRRFLSLLVLAAATSAAAHPSLVPHEHPHGASALPGLDLFLLAILAGMLALILWRRIVGRGSP